MPYFLPTWLLLILIPVALVAIYIVGVAVVAIKFRRAPEPLVLWMVAFSWPYGVWLWIRER